jgi:hypothetical protein
MSGSQSRTKTDPMPFGRVVERTASAPSERRTDPMLLAPEPAAAPMKRDTLRDAKPPMHDEGIDELPLSSQRTPPMGAAVVVAAREPAPISSQLASSKVTPRGLGPVAPALRVEDEILARALDAAGAAQKRKDFLSSSGENARLKAAVAALDADASKGSARVAPPSERQEFAAASIAPHELGVVDAPKVDVSRADPRRAATQRAMRAVSKRRVAEGPPTVPTGHEAVRARRARGAVVAVVALLAAVALVAVVARRRGEPRAASAPAVSGIERAGSGVDGRSSGVATEARSTATLEAGPVTAPSVSANAAAGAASASASGIAALPSPSGQGSASADPPRASASAKSAASAAAPSASTPPTEFYEPTPKIAPPSKKAPKSEFYQ